MAKKSLFSSMFNNKCPRCREGKLFKGPITEGIYNMHKNCTACGQAFELEPGFYWGAMYIGYGLSGGYMLSVVTFLLVVFDFSVNGAFILAILGGIVVLPLVARWARSIWIHIYVGYDKNWKEKETHLQQK